MAFLLSDDEDLIAKTVAQLAAASGLDAAADRDRHDAFPDDLLGEAAGLGLLGMGLSAEQGGAGITPTAYAAAVMEMAAICPNTAAVLAVHNGLALRILAHGTDAARAATTAGVVATLATEEAHGSWKKRLGTVAVPEGDGFRITGMKVWALGAVGAKQLIALAKGPDGPTFYLVPADAEGVTLGQPESLLGLRAAGIRTVYLSDVLVGADAVIGEPGKALEIWAEAQPWLQVGAAAAIVGATMGAFSAGKEFAADRVQFGKPIGTYQAVSDTITSIDMNVAAARALVFEAAAHLESEDAAAWAARAKAFAVEMSIAATRKVIRVQGGTGFMREGGSERFARDVRALQFIGEPVVMQKDALKRHLLDIDFGPTP